MHSVLFQSERRGSVVVSTLGMPLVGGSTPGPGIDVYVSF